MTVNEVKENLIPVLQGISSDVDVVLNDYDDYSMSIMFYVDRDVLFGDLRGISGKIRKKLSSLGISKKKGNILSWTAPIKFRDKWGDVDFKTDYFELDFVYSVVELNLESPFKSKYMIFDKYDILGENNKELEALFKRDFENMSNMEEHFETMSRYYELADYDLYPLFKYEHSGIHYELSQSCRWDSGLIGMIAIRKDVEDITPENIVDKINNRLL